MSSCPCSIPQILSIILLCFFCITVLLYWYHPFPSFLPSVTSLLHSLLLNAVFCISSSISPSVSLSSLLSPYSIPLFPLRCTHLCDRLLLTHSTSASPQMRAERANGRVWCRAQRTGFNEASLNEFTAFHWTALSHVADWHHSHCVRGPLSVLLPVCLTPL